METTSIIIIAIFAVIIVAAFLVFRQRGRVEVRGPLGTGLSLDVSNQKSTPAPGVKIEDAKSRKGGLRAEDKTGRGASATGVEVERDILITSTPPENDSPPK